MNPILVAGTGSWDDDGRVDWYAPGHPLGTFLLRQGVAPIYDGPRPFIWSTDLDGVPIFTSKKDWSAGGAALAYFVMAVAGTLKHETALIVHSHGLQVAAFAAAEHDLKIQTLISFGSPIRDDMAKEYVKLRANVGYWLHIHSDATDRWQWYGELFDGGWRRWFTGKRAVREAPLASRNDFVPGVGHSQLLRDPAQYHYWVEHGWVDLLKG